MSKNKNPKIEIGSKSAKSAIMPQIFKFRTMTNLYPKTRPQIKHKYLTQKLIIPNPKEKKKELYDLNQEFLFALVQPIFLLDKQIMHNTISNLILNSKLINKIEGDLETKDSLNSLMNTFIKNLTFRYFEKDSILYHTGETDNKFYFIIKGRLSSLKPIKTIEEMSFDDYILYLIDLKNKKEINLLKKVIILNSKPAPIKTIEDIKRINRIIFKRKLEKLINSEDNKILTDNNDLEIFFKEYYQDYKYYNMSNKELQKLLTNRGKIVLGVKNREWDDYILEHCKLTSDENSFFETFEPIFKRNRYIFHCFKYEYNEEYIDSDYFGEFSLEEDKEERNQTLRFEDDTTIAWITIDDYIDIISPQKKIEKKNDIMRLNNSFCFKDISERVFKRNYYEMFIKKQYSRNTIIFSPETESNSIFFIKKGKIALQLNCSIIDLHKLIKLILDKLNDVAWPVENYQKRILSKERLKVLEFQYLDDPLIRNMKSLDKTLKIELEKKRNFQIAVFSDFEMVGLEEVYLHMEHYAKAIVLGDKILYNELPISKFNEILQNEMRLIRESYVQVSVNRILSLLKRLFDIKQNFLSMAKIKNTADINQFYDNIVEESNTENLYYNYNYDKKLNINNNKTTIPQINFANKNTNNDEIKNENSRKMTLKSAKPIKSARKIRNYDLKLEINKDNKERAKSGKYEEKSNNNIDDEEFKINKNKIGNIIVVGNRRININQLKREINESKFIKDTEENSKALKKIDKHLIEQKQSNLTKSFEEKSNYNIEYQNSINVNKEKINTFKSKKFNRENISIKLDENEYFKSRKNNYSLFNMGNSNTINNYSNRLNLNFPMSISPIDTKVYHNLKSRYYDSITENIIKINKDKTKEIQTVANNLNEENSKLNFLPKIEQRYRVDQNLKNALNLNNINASLNRNQLNEKIPQIVKNYYFQIKQKGCIPLIANKKSNTIFLRKYHKKYNEN